MVVPTPADTAVGAWGVSVQSALDDGRVIERVHARPVRRSAAGRPGQRVLVWYDPADRPMYSFYGSNGV
jgi:hypothetical protein